MKNDDFEELTVKESKYKKSDKNLLIIAEVEVLFNIPQYISS